MYKITFEDNGGRKALTSSGRTETKVFYTYTEAEIILTSLIKHSMYDKKWAIEQLDSNTKIAE
ncbi:hypothetical protein [Salimicrobium flavidum]|uniref:Uncharacterized protein n=1 Tax=Salimicrobium flavidum TaxID=570947 RepID=A0A1N7J9C0_9BACI|nr:hypothetical protein [Salimicrobium flavidum]SIS45938.1 hypothetical protein SAMN05421687_104205 [Salimicrobium flavidum]